MRIRSRGAEFEGIVMPSSTDSLVLKLDSGYNIGLTDYEVLEVADVHREKFTPPKPEKRDELPTVKIISTGGTIASKVDYRTGAVTSQFSAEEIAGDVPEILDICNVDAKLLYNILSENMDPRRWMELAGEVYNAIKEGYEGIIVTHGTDTMGFSASALAFMLSTPVPVVFVGSQRSSDRPSSDAAVNLICAARTATSDLGEVAVVMHGTTSDDFCHIHRGVKVRKCHTSARYAFQSINNLPLGKVDHNSKEITWLSERTRRSEKELSLANEMEEKVALIKFYPGLKPDILDYYHEKGYRGFVIEGTGLGHTSTDWVDTLTRICEDSVVVMTSQCMHGRICDRVYDTGRDLVKAGVIEGEDMLAEVALIKLMWLLGNYDFEEAKQLMATNLVGEINPTTYV
ncbi:MAG: Glu-tRNA(Gln) amidotransferase subunit GatD [Candidatus Hadarchaeota archaeon]